jgi:lipopolysaccharide biosynthesis regulator YciM
MPIVLLWLLVPVAGVLGAVAGKRKAQREGRAP